MIFIKTVIFNGSARKNGYTTKMIDSFKQHIKGEIFEVNCYREKNISSCVDCRYCWKNNSCAIKDDMQHIYEKVEEADIIILASPMYFHSVTGVMKSILDRFQVYWAGHVRGDHDKYKKKKGAILMCGGAPTFENQFLAGELVLKGLLGDLNANCEGVITISNTDRVTDEDYNEVDKEITTLSKSLYN